MFEKNTKQVNQILAKIFAVCSVIIVLLVLCSYFGVFEFGTRYTWIVLVAGMLITIGPSILIRFLPDAFMKHYMLVVLGIFIGVLGTNNHIGIYISYVLVPIFACLYFQPRLIVQSSICAYLTMAVSLYINSAGKYEVVYMGMSRVEIFIAYLLGFTIEFVLVSSILYFVVKRAKIMMEERYSAEEENRMKSRFLSTMSHEIRTPMNAIIGMADVALREEMSDEVKKCVTIIKSSSMGLLEIVNDILDLSKIEAGKLNIITDAYLTKSLVEDMEAIIDARNIDHKVPIYYHVSGDLPPVLEGDAIRIKQVMLNYASNAIKYTESGRIDVTLTCEREEDGYVTLCYQVQDTGQGIRREDIGELFGMYHQFNVKKNHGKEGTGIGLAICKYIMDGMNGTISVDSNYGEGSTFSFRVRQKIVDAAPDEIVAASHEPSPYLFTAAGASVLLVDDNELNREVAKAVLEPLKLTIDEAENGMTAVKMASDKVYDMIFMDSHMPVMNGEEATKEIRMRVASKNQDTPIIALTADAIAGVKERLIDSGMDDYVSKPIRAEEICRVVREHLPVEKVQE